MQDQDERRGDTLADLQRRHDQFVDKVSHDVRNPLQVILLQAERLQRLLPDRGSREGRAADAIAATVHQLDALIKELVQEARGEAEGTVEDERSFGS